MTDMMLSVREGWARRLWLPHAVGLGCSEARGRESVGRALQDDAKSLLVCSPFGLERTKPAAGLVLPLSSSSACLRASVAHTLYAYILALSSPACKRTTKQCHRLGFMISQLKN